MSILFKGSDDFVSEPISIRLYSDGTPMVKAADWSAIVEKAHTLVLRPEDMNEFMTALYLVDALHLAGNKIKTLVLPYIPGARQDRSNPTGDVLFTLWSVARAINDLEFEDVVVLDPHSPVSADTIANLVKFPLAEVAKRMPEHYDGVISADKGGKDRAEQFARALGLPVYYGAKTRSIVDGKLTGFTLENLQSNKEKHHFLVVDDICDGGGTFNGLAVKIAEQGCTADLYVSHGIFSKGTDELKKNFEKIYTTDSRHINGRNDVTIIPVVNEMENYNG
jgi:ribose-phosphate pyrophosphokinase